MGTPNPLPVKLVSGRLIAIDEQPTIQIGTDCDFMELYPPIVPVLDDGSLTDLNTIYVDHTGGNDANAGTFALPVKTVCGVAGAVVKALAAGFTNICFKSTSWIYVEAGCVPKSIDLWYTGAITCQFATLYRDVSTLTDLNTKFFDPISGDDIAGDGTFALPYKTSQVAIDDLGGAFTHVCCVLQTFNTMYELNDNIYGQGVNRYFECCYKQNATEYTAGATLQINYTPSENAIAGTSMVWNNLIYHATFIAGGRIFLTGKNAAGNGVLYTVDSDYTLTSRDVGGAVTEYFGMKYFGGSGTLYLYYGTLAGVRKCTNAYVCSATNNATLTWKWLEVFNNNLLSFGASGIKRTPDDAAAWTVVSTDNVISNPVVYGSYCYYAIDGAIKRIDANWNTEIVLPLTEYTTISSMGITSDGYIVVIAYNSTNFQLSKYKISDWSKTTIATEVYTACPKKVWIDNDYIYIIVEGDLRQYNLDNNLAVILTGLDNHNDFYESPHYIDSFYMCDNSAAVTLKYIKSLSVLKIKYPMGIKINGLNKSRSCIGGFSQAYYCNSFDSRAGCSGYSNAEKSIFSNCFYGMFWDSYLRASKYNIVFNTTYAIYNNTATTSGGDIIHNAFDLCKYGLYFPTLTSYTDDIKNNIFTRCSYLYSNLAGIPITYSLIQSPCDTGDFVINETNCISDRPIFRDRDGIGGYTDYRLQVANIEASNGVRYQRNSAGVGGADDSGTGTGYTVATTYDMGAYLLTRNKYDDTNELTWETELFDCGVLLGRAYPNKTDFITISALHKIAGRNNRRNNINIPWKPADWLELNNYLEDLYNILEQEDPARLTINDWTDGRYTPTEFITLCQGNHLGIESGSPNDMGINCSFVANALTLTQTYTTWKTNRYKGFLVNLTFTVAAIDYDMWFKVLSNTDDMLTLYNIDNEDMRAIAGLTITNNTHDLLFVIGGLYVQADFDRLDMEISQIMSQSHTENHIVNITFEEAK